MDRRGLIHVYYGYGKGKTTCALGLSLRASGCGLNVVIVQFLKDMATGELEQLNALPNITVIRGKAAPTWIKNMTPEQLQETRDIHNSNLKKAIKMVEANECDLLVLDEVLDALQQDVLDEDLLRSIVCNKPDSLELVITGHSPTKWVFDQADYITEMRKERHPYDEGIKARKGIEF